MTTTPNPTPARPSLASTRDAIAHERHGCLYADLPDDGVTQDAITSEAARRLAGAAATPLPWYVDPTDAEGRIISASPCGSGAIAECGLDYSTLERNPGRANAALIVAAVNERPALLARVAALEAALRGLLAVGDGSAPDTGHAWEAAFAALAREGA